MKSKAKRMALPSLFGGFVCLFMGSKASAWLIDGVEEIFKCLSRNIQILMRKF